MAAAPAAGLAEPHIGERVQADSVIFMRAVSTHRFDSVLAVVARDVPIARASSNSRALARLGRALYARQLDIAQRRHLTWSMAQAFNELGSLEVQAGGAARLAGELGSKLVLSK